jgi:hypothetical protein
MKPVLTFVLGAVLASGIAVFLVKRSPEPAPTATETPAAATPAPAPINPEPAPVTATPEPVPVKETPPARGFARAESKPRKANRPAANVPTRSQPAVEDTTIRSTTTTTAANSESGPPQTTLSVPPAPGVETLAESKPAPPPRIPKTVTIPAGTLLSVRVDERLSSDTTQTGDSFRASLDAPLVVDGAVIAERGARIEGRVSESDRGGKVRGTATLALELVRMNTSDGQRVRLQTEGFSKVAQKSTKKDAMKVGIGAGLGAAIGAIAGGGKGAAIGAGVGGAAGTGAVMGTRGDAAEVPAETRLTFRLREPITVTEKLN